MEKYPELSITEVHFWYLLLKEKPKYLSEIARKSKFLEVQLLRCYKLSEKRFFNERNEK